MAYGLACAATIGPDVPLYVPENGFIGINVPLVGSRQGSGSTRTTHPRVMTGLRQLTTALGMRNEVQNPLRLRTKGEALAECRDPGTLAAMARDSISCAHPTAVRWAGLATKSCGYCYPCLIRRAAMHVVGLDRPEDYVWNVLNDPVFFESIRSPRSASLLAVIAALHTGRHGSAALLNGPLPGGEAAAFAEVYRRGLDELAAWLGTASTPALIARLP